ncbi:MAG: response regulator transcription factor [Coriobacteriia bacterium]|nr:response regulator transcription factor [Coriobacteriia bacterium]
MDTRATILIVEDNKRLLDASTRTLEEAGYLVLTAPDLATAEEHINNASPDAIVLDIMLPDGNGLDFIQKIRAVSSAPVLLTTSLGSKDDRLLGLQAGGDDYITKPFDLDEMCARVGAFLRREVMHQKSPERVISRGLLKLDAVAYRAYLNGQDMLLAPKEFLVLLLLVQNEGRALTAENLYEAIWKLPMAGDDHSVKNAIYRLRQKLNTGNSGFSIETSRGEGYRFDKVNAL